MLRRPGVGRGLLDEEAAEGPVRPEVAADLHRISWLRLRRRGSLQGAVPPVDPHDDGDPARAAEEGGGGDDGDQERPRDAEDLSQGRRRAEGE